MFESRTVRQTRERLHWIEACVAYMFQIQLFLADESQDAYNMAETLLEASIDEGGELFMEPWDAVDEELTYWGRLI